MARSSASSMALADPEPIASRPLSPERARLAEVLAGVASLKVEIAEVSTVLTKASNDRSVTSSALTAAERALERANPKADDGLTRHAPPPGAFWGEDEYRAYEAEQSTPPIPIADAREAVARATDARDSAKRLVDFYKDRLKRLTDDLGWRQSSIRDAVRAVVRADPALLALATESKRLATRAAAAAMAFELATSGDTIQPGSPFYGYNQPTHARDGDFEGWAVSRAWREALEQLSVDPTTPLPMVG